jgi:hypothetical protein
LADPARDFTDVAVIADISQPLLQPAEYQPEILVHAPLFQRD